MNKSPASRIQITLCVTSTIFPFVTSIGCQCRSKATAKHLPQHTLIDWSTFALAANRGWQWEVLGHTEALADEPWICHASHHSKPDWLLYIFAMTTNEDLLWAVYTYHTSKATWLMWPPDDFEFGTPDRTISRSDFNHWDLKMGSYAELDKIERSPHLID